MGFGNERTVQETRAIPFTERRDTLIWRAKRQDGVEGVAGVEGWWEAEEVRARDVVVLVVVWEMDRRRDGRAEAASKSCFPRQWSAAN